MQTINGMMKTTVVWKKKNQSYYKKQKIILPKL